MQADRPVFSTTGQDKPFEYWHDVVCQTFTALATEPLGSGAFAGDISTDCRLGDHNLSTITAGAQIVRRNRSGIAQRPSNSFFVNMQISGRCAVRVGDDETLLAPGDLIVLDADRPFAMQFDRDFRQACLHIVKGPEEVEGLRPRTVLRGAQSETKTLVRDVAAMREGGEQETALHSVLSLLRVAATEQDRRRLSAQHLTLIKTHIAQRSDEPSLGTAAVARHFRISKRHLHNLFAQAGESFGQYLLHRRLQRALMRLSETPHVSIGEVAHESGFGSASHFSRTFRQQFGAPPRIWRQAGR